MPITNSKEVQDYIASANKKTDRERQESKEKTGVELKGIRAINPVNKEEIPVWVADYVLVSYGTGAIMAVPGHDMRDNEFARKYKLPIVQVIAGAAAPDGLVYEGTMTNSGKFDGMPSEKARDAIAKFAGGKKTVQYKLRDWIFSRQHYWGEPIPIVLCNDCGYVPLEEDRFCNAWRTLRTRGESLIPTGHVVTSSRRR